MGGCGVHDRQPVRRRSETGVVAEAAAPALVAGVGCAGAVAGRDRRLLRALFLQLSADLEELGGEAVSIGHAPVVAAIFIGCPIRGGSETANHPAVAPVHEAG